MRTIINIIAFVVVCVGTIWIVKINADAIDGIPTSKTNSTYEETNETHAFLYVWDEKSELWNRAKDEDLKNAKCDQLKVYVRRR